jgi:hypothetical protein
MGILCTHIAAHNQALTFAFLTNIVCTYIIIYSQWSTYIISSDFCRSDFGKAVLPSDRLFHFFCHEHKYS